MGIDSNKFISIQEQIKILKNRGLYFNSEDITITASLEDSLRIYGFTKVVNYVENILGIKNDYTNLIADLFVEFQNLSSNISKIIAPEILKIENAFSESIIRNIFIYETKASNNPDGRWFQDLIITEISDNEIEYKLVENTFRFSNAFNRRYDWATDKFLAQDLFSNIENNVICFYKCCEKSWKRNYRFTEYNKVMKEEAIWHPIKTLSFGSLIRLYKCLNIGIQLNIIKDLIEPEFDFLHNCSNKIKTLLMAYVMESLSNLRNVIFHNDNLFGYYFGRRYDKKGNSLKSGQISLSINLGTIVHLIPLFKCVKQKDIIYKILNVLNTFAKKNTDSISSIHNKSIASNLLKEFDKNKIIIKDILKGKSEKSFYAKKVYDAYNKISVNSCD